MISFASSSISIESKKVLEYQATVQFKLVAQKRYSGIAHWQFGIPHRCKVEQILDFRYYFGIWYVALQLTIVWYSAVGFRCFICSERISSALGDIHFIFLQIFMIQNLSSDRLLINCYICLRQAQAVSWPKACNKRTDYENYDSRPVNSNAYL